MFKKWFKRKKKPEKRYLMWRGGRIIDYEQLSLAEKRYIFEKQQQIRSLPPKELAEELFGEEFVAELLSGKMPQKDNGQTESCDSVQNSGFDQ